MSRVLVAFWFDVEDYITPQSDEALKGIIEIFDRLDQRATFKLVGEKLRALERRGRTDIIDMLERHDIGYHTDYHSVHPTPAEYLKGLGWEEGREEFKRRECRGYEDIIRVFGRKPSCYGQPGSSWAPQVYPALRDWGIKLYMDECPQIGLNEEPFWFCGVLNVLRMGKNLTRCDFRKGEEGLREAVERFDSIADRLKSQGGGLVSIYYHPCEFSTYQFWDAVNFARGANPSPDKWKTPEVKPPEEMRRGLDILRGYVEHICSRPDVKLVTASEIVELYPDEAAGAKLSIEELKRACSAIAEEISYVDLGEIILSPAELFLTVCRALEAYGQLGRLPREVEVGRVDGPESRSEDDGGGSAPTESIVEGAVEALEFMEERGRMPDSVKVGNCELPPAVFLRAACRLICADGDLAELPLEKARLKLEDEVRGEGVWGWIIFPEGFDAPELIELARAQAWTLKPARLKG